MAPTWIPVASGVDFEQENLDAETLNLVHQHLLQQHHRLMEELGNGQLPKGGRQVGEDPATFAWLGPHDPYIDEDGNPMAGFKMLRYETGETSIDFHFNDDAVLSVSPALPAEYSSTMTSISVAFPEGRFRLQMRPFNVQTNSAEAPFEYDCCDNTQ